MKKSDEKKELERKRKEAAKFGFKKHQVLDGTSADAAAYRRNSWMF